MKTRLAAPRRLAVQSYSLKTLAQIEREAILATMQIVKGNKLEACRVLGIGKTTLYRKLIDFEREDKRKRRALMRKLKARRR